MKDTLTKLRALVSMKSTLIDSLRADLQRAVRIIRVRDQEIDRLNHELEQLRQQWWAQMDSDAEWIRSQCSETEQLSVSGDVDVVEPSTTQTSPPWEADA